MNGDVLPPLREVVRRLDLRARKSLGQNFLFDLNLTGRIARSIPDIEDTTVIEVGPGPGGLTRMLFEAGAACVIAIERDPRFFPALEEISRAYDRPLRIVEADALRVDERELLEDTRGPVPLAANLPYNIGTALLAKWLETEDWPPFWSSLTLMFQKEVADRIMAGPGTANYGRLSVLAQWRCRVKRLMTVPPAAFVPPPKVTSSVIRISPGTPALPGVSPEGLAKLTRATFGKRRKMLRQSLKALTDDPEAVCRAAGIDPAARPETLCVDNFLTLERILAQR